MTRLYTVVDAYTDDDYTTVETYDGDYIEVREPIECPFPEQWDEFCVRKYGETREFFLPATGRIYKSRSAAVDRANLIKYWGGKAVVMECEPQWQTLENARRGRELPKLNARIIKIEAQLQAEYKKLANA